ncbi:MAG: altronate dehydratase family protein [Lachnospiraceae bacterium]|nr:altronate dehydratase family protein [Lachnospiraceae bacterium]
MKAIHIHPLDNVAVALSDIDAGEKVLEGENAVKAAEKIARGHKMALKKINKGEDIIKYGNVIARAKCDIEPGQWVHTHNAETELSEGAEYSYDHISYELPSLSGRSFDGYLRADGRAAVRNEIWIIPTVGCVNGVANELVKRNQNLVGGLGKLPGMQTNEKYKSIDGLYSFTHPFGCSQLGGDLEQTKKVLADLVHHPNAGGVLVLSLGCENLTLESFKEALGDDAKDSNRVKFLVCQDVEDEVEEGSKLLKELADYASQFKRQEISADKLVIGMKCGGSDGLSGITANPTVGRFSDRLIALGGSTILTEVPEMFGAEKILFSRCKDKEVFNKAVKMVDDFKKYFTDHGQVVYENPSPGNKAGGITTLEDKSCGCVQKGGSAQIVDVLPYAGRVEKKGLNLLSGPGNDLVSATDLTAAGAQLILFTTGRGTPFGAPAPTIKISTNTALYEKKAGWIDFNAGSVAEGGESLDEAGDRLLDFVLETASGRQTASERSGCREISIFKDGVVL